MTGDTLKILAICLITAVICVILKPKSGEFALTLVLCTGAMVLAVIFKNIAVPIAIIGQRLAEYGIETEYFKVALKALGIAYVTSFIADACRDSGQTSLAAKAEMAGKSAIFLLSVPLMISIIETAVGFVK